MSCSFPIHLFVILETMITWCDIFIHFSIVYIFTLSHSWFTVDSYSYNSYLPFTCKDYLNYYPYLSYYLLLLLTIPGSCDQDPVISIFHIHGISKCMTGIFSQVTIHDSIQYSVIIDTIKRDLENTTLNISQSHLIAKKKLKDLTMAQNDLRTSISLINHTMGLYLNKKQVIFFTIYTEEILEWHRITTIHCKSFTTIIIKHSAGSINVFWWIKHESSQGTPTLNQVSNLHRILLLPDKTWRKPKWNMGTTQL